MSGHVSLPDGCTHIAWRWENPDGDPTHPELGDLRGQLVTEFVSWSVPAGQADTRDIAGDTAGLEAQGLELTPGSLHLCQRDPDSGAELWVSELQPASDH